MVLTGAACTVFEECGVAASEPEVFADIGPETEVGFDEPMGWQVRQSGQINRGQEPQQ